MDLAELGELSEANEKIAALTEEVDGMKAELTEAEERVAGARMELREATKSADRMEAEIAKLEARISELEGEVQSAEEGRTSSAIAAIEEFFKEVDRPVGTLNYTVPNCPSAQRALIRLSNVVNGQEGGLL